MIGYIKFLIYFRKNKYAKALSCLPSECKYFLARQQYALYRLGMYSSVLNHQPIFNSWRSMLAQTVSSAASGNLDKFNLLASSAIESGVLKHRLYDISISILPYYPDWSLRFLPKKNFEFIELAANFKIGKFNKCKDFLRNHVNDKNSEIYLFYSNIYSLKGEDFIKCLNKFLEKSRLGSLNFDRPGLAVNALNFKSADKIEIFKNGPLVSVIMTAYRCADRIEYSINSLLRQSYENLEVVVIDDCSDDDLRDVVNNIINKDYRVKYKRLPVNVGTYVAKTIGLRLATGEFVTCQDSDDWAHPQKIEMQMKPLIENNSIVYTISNLVRISDNGLFYARAGSPLMRLNPSSVLFRKNKIESEVGFWDLVRTGADSEFIARLRIAYGKSGFVKINKPLSFCSHRENSLMTSRETGYNSSGFSEMRLKYWEYFSSWHIDCLRNGVQPKMTNSSDFYRLFPAPEENIVPMEKIKKCFDEIE